jgi:VanZ family protein
MKRSRVAAFWIVLAACVAASLLAYRGALRLEGVGIPHLDFYAHLTMMGLLAFFADGMARSRRLAFVPLGPAIVLLVASTDEVLQRLSAYRSSSWSDFIADTIGVTLGALVAARIARVTARRDRATPA